MKRNPALKSWKVAQLTKKLCLQWNLNFQNNTHRNPPRDHILVHIYPVHTITPHATSISLRHLCLGLAVHIYRASGRRVTKYCMMAPNISGSSGWNLLHVNFEVNPRFFPENLCTPASLSKSVPFTFSHPHVPASSLNTRRHIPKKTSTVTLRKPKISQK